MTSLLYQIIKPRERSLSVDLEGDRSWAGQQTSKYGFPSDIIWRPRVDSSSGLCTSLLPSDLPQIASESELSILVSRSHSVDGTEIWCTALFWAKTNQGLVAFANKTVTDSEIRVVVCLFLGGPGSVGSGRGV